MGAVFASTPYRPPLSTPRPRITGVQSAVVVGLPGEEIHVDEHGRIRVLFAWDQEGERGDRSSCWVRVSQSWAGAGFGVVAIPRIGDEVLVTFFDGDPDQPVVVGRLHNATHLHPFRLPREKTITGIRTRSSRGGLGHNELAFEDRAGFEAIRLHAHKDFVEDVLNDHHTIVHRDDVTRVHGDLSLRVEGTQAVSIGKNALVAVQGDRTEVVFGVATENHEGASELHAGGDRGERFDAGYRLTVAGPTRIAHRGGKEELVTGAAVTRVVGPSSALYTSTRKQEVIRAGLHRLRGHDRRHGLPWGERRGGPRREPGAPGDHRRRRDHRDRALGDGERRGRDYAGRRILAAGDLRQEDHD